MKPEKICKILNLTPEQLKELQDAAWITWNNIGYDCIQANNGKDIPRNQVIEIVLDADHIVSNNPRLSPEVHGALKYVDGYSEQKQKAKYAAMKLAFPCSRYGM